MKISELDIKLLWGNSGNRCAICRTELSQDKALAAGKIALGEQAHIVAEKVEGPRGNSTLDAAERNRYHNLILLCPNHHTEIDKDADAYPVDRLHMIKTEHEQWVRSKLAEAATDPHLVVAQQVYASLIDKAVTAGDFERWSAWTSWALGPEPTWSGQHLDEIRVFRRAIIAAVWGGQHPELEASLRHFSRQLHLAGETFREHARSDGEMMRTIKFYRTDDHERFRQLIGKFEDWQDRCHATVIEANKAANWLAQCVRRYVNPSFFAIEGKFITTYSTGTEVQVILPEYEPDEIAALIKEYGAA